MKEKKEVHFNSEANYRYRTIGPSKIMCLMIELNGKIGCKIVCVMIVSLFSNDLSVQSQ